MIGAIVLFFVAITGAQASKYCVPADPCWPDAQAWQQLGRELGEGVLKEIANVSVVYSECAKAFSYGLGGAILNQVANGTCEFAGVCVYKDCKEGNAPYIPVYSIEAKSAEHVQVAVRFANEHRIRVSVKSTGASYSLADQQPDSILIWMSNFPKYSEAGVDVSFTDSCGTKQDAVLKVGGGETWGSVFKALAADGKYVASSGAAVTVGASGGWLQGGGLGPLDRDLGLGVDNVVQFELVLADGSLKTVDACSEPDLFWALRGGGGGNWGVVVSQTSKVHPVKPMVRAYIVWAGSTAIGNQTKSFPDGTPIPFPNKFDGNKPVYWTKNAVAGENHSPTLSMWHDVMLNLLNPATMDNRLDGYYGVGCFWQNFICADLYFRGTMEEFEAAFLGPLRKALNITQIQGNGGSGEAFMYLSGEYRSYYDYASTDCKEAKEKTPEYYICHTLGYPSANGYQVDAQLGQGGFESRVSWIVPTRLFLDEGRALMKELLAEPLFFYAMGHVLGGQVNDVHPSATAVHPAMRASTMEFLLVQQLDPNSPSMEHIRGLINKYFPPPQSAPVFNHDALNLEVLTPLGESHGLTWQQLYWGSNLERLQRIKASYDRKAIFTCRDCVTAAAESGIRMGDVLVYI